MHFGVFTVLDHYLDLPRSVDQLYDEVIEQAVAAEELGFGSFWVAEHHFHEYGACPNPAVLLAAIAARTRRIRLGVAVSVLPFHHPLEVAEAYAMVDRLSGGRLDLGVGSGYLAHEFSGYGIDPAEKRDRFDEALPLVLRAMGGERIHHAGRFYRVDGVQLNVAAMQQPHPPYWVALLRREAVAHVGRQGRPIMMVPYASVDRLEEMEGVLGDYRRALRDGGHDAEAADVPLAFHVHVGDDAASVRAAAEAAMTRYVRTRLYAKRAEYDSLVERRMVLFGDPDRVSAQIADLERWGMTRLLAMLNFGGLGHRTTLRVMERLAREVAPRFQSSFARQPLAAAGLSSGRPA
ncbi:MAG TPA: LLM class flavin-dependent oxidoreductase [Thermodesulfobacteriota bacterium]